MGQDDRLCRLRAALWPLFVTKLGSADSDRVAVLEKMLGDTFRVHEYAIFAAPVNDPCAVMVGNDYGMSPADIGSIKLYIVLLGATDGQSIFEQRES